MPRNNAAPLTSEFNGSIDTLPPEWQAKLGFTKVVQEKSPELHPSDLTATIIGSTVEQDETSERKKTIYTIGDPSAVSMVEHFLTPDAQDGTRTKTLRTEAEAVTLPAFTATTLGIIQHSIGNGYVIQEVESVGTVFPRAEETKAYPQVIPEEFLANAILTESSSELAGTSASAATPDLYSGNIRTTAQQLTAKKIKTGAQARTLSLPITLSEQILTSEFGGDVATRVRILASGQQTITGSTALVSASVKNLGNGASVKETVTRTASDWPILTEYDQDEETQSLIATTYQIVDSATVSAPSITQGKIKSFKRIDQWRSLKIERTISKPADYTEYRFGAYNFPALLDLTHYYFSDDCGPYSTERDSFSSQTRHKTLIHFADAAEEIIGLVIIPNSIHFGRGAQFSNILNDQTDLIYVGDCAGGVTVPASNPSYSTYVGSYQNSYQLIQGESVLWKAGYFKSTRLYVWLL